VQKELKLQERKRNLIRVLEMLGYIFIIVAILLAVFLGCLTHAGFFYTLRIRTTIPYSIPSRVAYKVYRGPYKNAGGGFNDIEKVAPSLKKFGLYYDNPEKVSQSRHDQKIIWGGGGAQFVRNYFGGGGDNLSESCNKVLEIETSHVEWIL
jgi:hypothetical protein